MYSPTEVEDKLQQIEINARAARTHLKDAEFALQRRGSIVLALSHLVAAGLVFSDCLTRLREIESTYEELPWKRGRLDMLLPFTFCYSKDLTLFLSYQQTLRQNSMN